MSSGPGISTKRRLVGQPLIYAMTVFISLGVFLVRTVSFKTGRAQTTDLPYSLATIKGTCSHKSRHRTQLTNTLSVMSGIITGPYFKKYFNEPEAGELGLMVSVLEIGALSTALRKFAGTPQPSHSALNDAPQLPRLLPGASVTRSAAGVLYFAARWFSPLGGQFRPSPGASPAWSLEGSSLGLALDCYREYSSHGPLSPTAEE